MLRRILILASLMLLVSLGAMKAQTAKAAGAAQAQPKDAIDVKTAGCATGAGRNYPQLTGASIRAGTEVEYWGYDSVQS
jgi:hypothetical protein